MGSEVDEELAGRTVTIRQTKNSYVREPQYILYKKVALDYRGWLDLENLGLEPEGDYWVAARPGKLGPLYGGCHGWVESWRVREALEAGDGMITIVEWDDIWHARRWWVFVQEHEINERSRKYWAGVREKVWVPVAQWIGGASPSPTTATARMMDPQVPERGNGAEDDNQSEVVTERPIVLERSALVHRRRGGVPTVD